MNGDGAPRVPNTANIRFDYIEGEAMVIALDLKGLAVSTGAACSSGAIEPSHVLIAMGLRPEQARASIRFSLGKQTVAEDIDFALRSCRKRWRACGNCRRCIRKRLLARSFWLLARTRLGNDAEMQMHARLSQELAKELEARS